MAGTVFCTIFCADRRRNLQIIPTNAKWPLVLRGHLPSKLCKPLFFLQMPENRSGAESRTRTDDLLITNQLLYQLSYFGPPLRLYRCVRLG